MNNLKMDFENLLNDEIYKKCIENSNKHYSDRDITNFKTFCSWNIKFDALRNAIKNIKTTTLLDIASGRGNDMNRWSILKIPKVIGIEYDKQQFEEAIIRYKNSDDVKSSITYINMSATDNILVNKVMQYNDNKKVNIITCNFALNYFIDSEQFFINVSNLLNTDGLFIGTAADGDFINFIFNNFGTEINSKLYYMKKLNDQEYEFKLNSPYFKKFSKTEEGAITEDYKTIIEKFIYKKNFVEIAKKYGLVPYSIKNGTPAIVNLSNYPIGKDPKSDSYYRRHVDLATLYFSFTFIKASEKLLNNVINPKCLVVEYDSLNKILEQVKNVDCNYVIIKKKDDIIPDFYLNYYPVNTILFFKEEHDYFSERRYTNHYKDFKNWDIMSVSVENLKKDFEHPNNYVFCYC